MSKEKVKMAISPTGRIQIPKYIRDQLGVTGYEVFNVTFQNGKVVMELDRPRCSFCNTTQVVANHNDKHICQKCLNILNENNNFQK